MISNSTIKRFLGAIQSKHPAVFLAMAIKILAPLTRLFDQPLYFLNKTEKVVDLTKNRCIFIVCPPRSGGTLVYQSLVRTLPSVFLCNAHAAFPNLGTKILRRGNKKLSQLSFNNFYGYTSSLIDVYEGNEFFNWAHQPLSGIDSSRTRQEYVNRFMKVIERLAPLPNECIIFKNVRAYTVLKKIHEAIPEIFFVRVRRDRSQVIESVVRAYYDLGYFNPIPAELAGNKISDPIEFACAQIEAIEAELDKQFSAISTNSKFVIQYEDFCNGPYRIIQKLASAALNLPSEEIINSPALNSLTPSKSKKVSEEDKNKIQAILKNI